MKKILSLTLLLSILLFTLQSSAQEKDPAVLNTATITLPISGITFTETKSFDPRKNTLVRTAVDKSGKRIDPEAARANEDKLYREKFGKLSPDVFDAVQSRKSTDIIKVGLLINTPDLTTRQNPKKGDFEISDREAQGLSEKNNQEVDAVLKKAAAPLVEYLARLKRLPDGFEKEKIVSPVISVTVTVAELMDLVKRPEIATIFLEEGKLEAYLNSSAKTLNAPSVWLNSIIGTGVCVAVVEGGRVDFNNPFLSSANCGTFRPSAPLNGGHTTQVAGVIAASTFGAQNKGIAFGSRIYSANGDYSSFPLLHGAMDAGANNAHISNNSWGFTCGNGLMDVFAVHADAIVRNKWDGIVGAAGNSGSGACGKVSATALGYNTIAVGSYNDKKTGFNLTDDVMSTFSSTGNPIAISPTDREKPDVSAPGEDIVTTTTTVTGAQPNGGPPWVTGAGGVDGTSFASPMIAGVHALVQQAKPSLVIYPETTKAILLASAVHNIEGPAWLSDKDGAGGVDAKVAYETTINNRFRWWFLTSNSFGSQGFIDVNLGNIPPGRRVKVALDWLSNPNAPLPDQLGIDLDLTIFDPQMNIVAGDGRWTDSKEIGQFYTTSTAPGNYTARFYRYSWNTSINPWTYTALAWSIS
jgi:hypothetical protein